MSAQLQDISEETLALIKSQTSGVNSSTGITGVDLSGVISLVPVVTPFRDMLGRTGPEQGSKVAEWKALLNVNNAQPDPAVAFDAAGSLAVLKELDVFAGYTPLAMGYTVTEDSVYLAKGYADAKAIAIFNALNQWKIGEDKKAIGAQNFALAQPAAPTLTAAATGGNIASGATVHVGVAARTGSNYFWGGNSKGNVAQVTVGTTTSTNSVNATVAAVRGAVAYDWFYSADGTTWHYYTTTTVNKVAITSTITVDQAVPNLPDLSATTPVFSSTTDNSAKANDFNGLLATLAGDYGSNSIVTPGAGTSSGAVFQSLDGASLTLSGGGIAEIDNLLLSIYNQVRLSPDALMVSSAQSQEISNLVLGSNSATTFLQPTDAAGRSEVVASGWVGTYLNRAAAGARVRLEVHPHLPAGTIIARTDRVPFPNSNISKVCEMRVLKDVSEYVYGTDRASGGPREDGEVRSLSTFINRAPVAMGVLQNVG